MTSFTRLHEETDFFDEELKSIRLLATRLSGKEFEGCSFTHCSFRECQFLDCKFVDCTFVDCDLSSTTFQGSSFSDVRFEKCKIAGVNWTLVRWSKFAPDAPIRFEESVLDYSTFIGLTFRKLVLRSCTAREIDFSDANLSGADFGKTDLAGSRFRTTNLSGANFVDALNYTIDVTLNDVKKARFNLPEAVSLLRSLDIVIIEDEP